MATRIVVEDLAAYATRGRGGQAMFLPQYLRGLGHRGIAWRHTWNPVVLDMWAGERQSADVIVVVRCTLEYFAKQQETTR
jgi:hypothetical protein